MGSEQPSTGRDFPASESIFNAQKNAESDEVVKQFCLKAGVDKPFQLSSWLFYRALGCSKVDAADLIGVSSRTLTRWEEKLDDNLTRSEYALLVKQSVFIEYDERIGGVER